MKITRDNYEIYFIDYLDGSLSPDAVRELKAFLLVNRDLEELLEDTEECRLPLSTEQFSQKESLKKTACHECPDYYAIAAAENELTPVDKAVLGKRLFSPVFLSLTRTYKSLKLIPDMNIRFEQKRRLYRKDRRKVLLYRTAGIAAGLLILFGIGFSFLHTNVSPATQLQNHELTKQIAVSSTPAIPSPETPVQKAKPTPEKHITHTHTVKSTPPKTEKRQPLDQLPPIGIISVPIAAVESDEPALPLELMRSSAVSTEIFLTGNAQSWKQSGTSILSDNIVTSAISTGKNLTEIIKERIAERRSNKSAILYVIQ